jgi:inositol transport system substrate-binding protein
MREISKRTLFFAAAAIVALILSGCSVTVGNQGGATPGAKREVKDSYRVAYIARTQTDSFAAWLANSMKTEAKKYDDIELTVFDGQGDDEVENRAIENAVANKFDAIMVQANNADAQRPYIQSAIDAGIVTIATNPRVADLTGGNTVDADPYEQGAVVARHAVGQIPKNGTVVVLDGVPGNYHGDNRRKAWKQEFFDKRPDVTIAHEDTANWQKDEALSLMEDWSLATPKIDAVISMNDNMAAGAIEAIKGKSNFSGIQAYGVDGTPEAALMIQSGTMTATSLQNATELAELNFKSVHDLLTNVTDHVDVAVGNPLIVKDNAAGYIEKYKKAGLIDG